MLSVDEKEVNDEDELFTTDETDIDTPETRLSEDARLLCEDQALGQMTIPTFNENFPNADVPKSPISSCVTVPGRNQTTLVAQLNQDPNLSHDRLARVRQRQEYQTVEERAPTNTSMVSLFDD